MNRARPCSSWGARSPAEVAGGPGLRRRSEALRRECERPTRRPQQLWQPTIHPAILDHPARLEAARTILAGLLDTATTPAERADIRTVLALLADC